jgi:anti-sigma B factor antagonist
MAPDRPLRENPPMARQSYSHFDLKMLGDVAVASVASPEIRHPGPAQELGDELASLVACEGHRKIVVDLGHTHYLSSTAFAVLLGFARKVEAAGGQLRIAGMQPDVLVGANIIGLGRIVDLCPDVRSALAAFE